MKGPRSSLRGLARALCAVAVLLGATVAPAQMVDALPPTGQWVADAEGCKVWAPRAVTGVTVQWRGACDAGLAEGPGELRWMAMGRVVSLYQGDMKAGRRNGQGVLTLTNGMGYEGGFADDQFNGPGVLRMPGGSTTRGQFVAGRAEGPGRIEHANGDRYEGQLRRGVASGAGRYDWAQGDRYEGEFAGGQPSGTGEYRFADGSVYTGAFVQGVPAGRGRLVLASGVGFEGAFASGAPSSAGAFFRTDGTAVENSPELRTQLSLRYARTPSAPSARSAVTAAMVCRTMARPNIPALHWKGTARYRALATVKQGKVTAVEITVMTDGIPREANRALAMSIEQALRAYDCPGDHVFEQEFQFALN